MTRTFFTSALVATALMAVLPAAHAARRHHGRKMIAYDGKDKRYYSVAWTKAHGTHDRGGDPLAIVPRSRLPKEAKESRAMHGAKM